MSKKHLKIGVVGSRSYVNRDKMVKIIAMATGHAKEEFDVIIVSGGQNRGADGLAKDLAINHFNLPYHEFAPRHYRWNEYCVPPKEEYEKAYSPKYYFDRNEEIAKYCDVIFAFVCSGVPAHGTMHTVAKARELGKKVIIVKD